MEKVETHRLGPRVTLKWVDAWGEQRFTQLFMCEDTVERRCSREGGETREQSKSDKREESKKALSGVPSDTEQPSLGETSAKENYVAQPSHPAENWEPAAENWEPEATWTPENRWAKWAPTGQGSEATWTPENTWANWAPTEQEPEATWTPENQWAPAGQEPKDSWTPWGWAWQDA